MLSGVKFISRDQVQRKEEPLNRYSTEDDETKCERQTKSNPKKEKVSNYSEERNSIDSEKAKSFEHNDIIRKEMRLDWMLKPSTPSSGKLGIPSLSPSENPAPEEGERVHSRELNPYLKNSGSGYPDEEDDSGNKIHSSSGVGDGGASWRMKALKRAKEQAAREGRKLEEVVGERWDSLGQLAVSVSSNVAAPAHAHLHAIKTRKRGIESESPPSNYRDKSDRRYLRDGPTRNLDMKMPKDRKSLSWGKKKGKGFSSEDSSLIASATASLNKFSDDGSFMSNFLNRQTSALSPSSEKCTGLKDGDSPTQETVVKENLSANQLAAKAMQLRLKGKNEEADKLMQEVETLKAKPTPETPTYKERTVGQTSRSRKTEEVYRKSRSRKDDEDSDRFLAESIMKDKSFSLGSRADDEYEYEKASKKKAARKGHREHSARGFMTQQQQCNLCFENPKRAKHLVVSIGNFTYLTLPHWEPITSHHCCIATLEHELSTRGVDNEVWEEIRNFKKCLIKMFALQEKEVVFLETVIGMAKQRRHCVVECIPIPSDVAKEAPMYFKKAIDEAEDEWSQHNAKKLIDTTHKGLRGSIPKDFPYFHVEFGLDRGFVHVIDDEDNFTSNFGLNVIRGMLRLPEEDMYRPRRYGSGNSSNDAVPHFVTDWDPFDWTKGLSN